MKKMNIKITVALVALFFGAAAVVVTPGCKSSKKNDANQAAASQPQEKHEAHHGGCLNAIETCAVGHAEVKLEGDVLKVWFVGGENETDKAVRVSDKQIVLAVKPDDGSTAPRSDASGSTTSAPSGQEKALTLDPKPNALADEKVGDCSYFEGKADWLAGVKKFSATGKVTLKGQERPIKIEYPEGYDPD